MGQIFAHITCTRVKWECEDSACDHYGCMDYPTEEHGWIDRRWSSTELHDSRNDVAPAINLGECSEDLAEEIRDLLGWLEGGYVDNGNGTFYSEDSYKPLTESWHYSYAVHFTRKFFGQKGWTEEWWTPPQEWLNQ